MNKCWRNAEFTNQLEGYEGVTAQCHNCESSHTLTRANKLWGKMRGFYGALVEGWDEGDFGEDMIDIWARTQANHLGCAGGYRWQLERTLHNEMAVVYALFRGMSLSCYYIVASGKDARRR